MISTNYDAALLFFKILFGTKRKEHLLLIWNKANKQSNWFDSIEKAAAFSAEQAKKPGHDLYVGTGLIEQKPAEDAHKKRIKNDEVSTIGGFWLDVDIKHELHKKQNLPETYEEAIALVESFEIKPTFIINSGHGLQAWWCFDEVWNFASVDEHAEAYNLSKRLQYFFKAEAAKLNWDVDSTFDLSRIFRIPGTINYKSERKAVEILQQNESLPIETLKKAILALPQLEDVETANKSKSSIKSAPPLSKSDLPNDIVVNARRTVSASEISARCANDRQFNLTWNRKRKDLQDQSASSYDYAIINYGIKNNLSNQEIVDLMIEWRKSHNEDLKLDRRESYYAYTLNKARETYGKKSNASRFIDADTSNDKDEIRQSLQSQLGLPISRIERTTEEPFLFSVRLEDGSTINLGDADGLIIQKNFRKHVTNATKHFWREFKKSDWEGIVQKLLQVCEDVEAPEEATHRGIVRQWLEQYLASSFGEIVTEEGYESRLVQGHPIIVEEKPHITLQDFKNHIEIQSRERPTREYLSHWLKSLGCIQTRINVPKAIIGRATTRRFFVIPADGDLKDSIDYWNRCWIEKKLVFTKKDNSATEEP